MITFWWLGDCKILAMKCTQRLEMWALGWTKLIYYWCFTGLSLYTCQTDIRKIFQPPFALMFMLYLIYFDNKTDFPHWWIAFLGDYENVFFSVSASLTEADDWLADWRSNINSAFSCRLCVMAFHINHPQWLLTLCRKSWPSGLRLELWGCILSSSFFSSENENEGSHTRKVKLG